MFAVLAIFALIVGVFSVRHASAKNDNGNNDSEGDNHTTMMGDHGGMNIRMGNHNDNDEGDMENDSAEHQSVKINANGDFTVTGAVVNSVSSSTNMVNASLYGLSKDVNLGSATLVGRGHAITISDISVGDKVSAKGNYNAATRTITVSELHDISFKSREIQDIQSKIQALLDMVRKLQDQLKSLQH